MSIYHDQSIILPVQELSLHFSELDNLLRRANSGENRDAASEKATEIAGDAQGLAQALGQVGSTGAG